MIRIIFFSCYWVWELFLLCPILAKQFLEIPKDQTLKLFLLFSLHIELFKRHMLEETAVGIPSPLFSASSGCPNCCITLFQYVCPPTYKSRPRPQHPIPYKGITYKQCASRGCLRIWSLEAVVQIQGTRDASGRTMSAGCSSYFMRLAEEITALRAWSLVASLIWRNLSCSRPALYAREVDNYTAVACRIVIPPHPPPVLDSFATSLLYHVVLWFSPLTDFQDHSDI